MRKDSIEKEIREDWFKNHKAEYEVLNDRIATLTWSNNGSFNYYTRYVFDGSKMYVSGDIGEAVFCFTEKAIIDKIKKYDIHYFHGKMSAFCEDEYSFDSQTAIARLNEEIESIREDMDYDTDYDDDDNEIEVLANTDRNEKINEHIDILKDLIDEAESCSFKSNWDYVVNQRYDDLTDYDCDVYEWIHGAGDVIPRRVYGYLIGIKMAAEQLNKELISA